MAILIEVLFKILFSVITWAKISTPQAFFNRRIYLIISVLAFYCLSVNTHFAQEIGAYKTIAIGNFEDIAIWEVFDGLNWTPASTKPTQSNDVYIEHADSIRLTANEQVKSLYINADSGAALKLNLNNFNLDIYGTLQAFSGAAPGTPALTIASTNWIGNSINSTITFKGSTRVIIPDGAWSAQTLYSKYSVIFNPDPEAELTVQRAVKALKFTVRSGTLVQKINTTSVPNACATFSFNTHNSYGTEDFGHFIIEDGATFKTECNSGIIFRSDSKPASTFQLDTGGELIILGTSPQIEAVNFQLNGKVTFLKNTGTQAFFSKSIPASSIPSQFHHLEIQGSQGVQIPENIAVSGDIIQQGAGAFDFTNTHLHLNGTAHQRISGFALNANHLTLNKSGGTVLFSQDVTIRNSLKMVSGSMDFQGKQLTINTNGSGGLEYTNGSWKRLSVLNYRNTPSMLDSINATFPFEDQYHMGIRKVQLSGSSAGGNLSIRYQEYEGVDTNPGFNDTDGTPIKYRLFSYFQFSGLNPSTEIAELKIAADNLIVHDPKHLRLVGTGYVAPGEHIESLDENKLWAIRKLKFNELTNKNFTVGSILEPSILPIIWLKTKAVWEGNFAIITWSSTENNVFDKYEVYRIEKINEPRKLIGEIEVRNTVEDIQSFAIRDLNPILHRSSFYQIKKVSAKGNYGWSQVIRLEGSPALGANYFKIYPNPGTDSEEVHLIYPSTLADGPIEIFVHDHLGRTVSSFTYSKGKFRTTLAQLQAGSYLIRIVSRSSNSTLRWIKN